MRALLLTALYGLLIASDMLGLKPVWEKGLSGKNAFLFILLLVVLVDASQRRTPLPVEVRRIVRLFVVLTLFAGVSLGLGALGIGYSAHAYDRAVSFKGLLLDHLLFFVVYLYGARTLSEAKAVVWGVLIVILLANVITLADVFGVPRMGIVKYIQGRVSGPLGEPNQYAAFSAMFIPVLGGLMLRRGGFSRVLYGFAFLVTFAMLLVTGSRGAWVGLFMGGLAASLIFRRDFSIFRVSKATLVAAALIASAVGLAAIRHADILQERIAATTERRDVTAVSSGRLVIWQAALKKQAEQPETFVWGNGWASFTPLTGYVSHNSYLEIFFNLGAIGLTLFVALLVSLVGVMRRAIRTADQEDKPLIVGFIVGFLSLLMSVFFVNLYNAWLLIWGFVGAMTRVAVEVSRKARDARPAHEQVPLITQRIARDAKA